MRPSLALEPSMNGFQIQPMRLSPAVKAFPSSRFGLCSSLIVSRCLLTLFPLARIPFPPHPPRANTQISRPSQRQPSHEAFLDSFS